MHGRPRHVEHHSFGPKRCDGVAELAERLPNQWNLSPVQSHQVGMHEIGCNSIQTYCKQSQWMRRRSKRPLTFAADYGVGDLQQPTLGSVCQGAVRAAIE